MVRICIFITCILLVQRLISILLVIFCKSRWYFRKWTIFVYLQ